MVMDSFNKTLLLGLGALVLTKEKAEEIIRDLIKKGEVSREDGKKLLEEITSRAGEEGQRLNEMLTDRIQEVLTRMGTPSQEDIDRLERKMQILEERVEELEKEQ